MKPILAAIFATLTSFSAFGGEWHSAGNAPVMPHVPTGPASYKCTLTAYTSVGKKQYRFSQERVIEDREFRGQNPFVYMALANTGDPGMDGQSFSLSFGLGENGEEILKLGVGAVIESRASARGLFEARRTDKIIHGRQDLNIERPARGGAKSVRVQAECRDLN